MFKDDQENLKIIVEEMDLISEKDIEFIKKKVHKAIHDFDWETATKDLLEAEMDAMYDGGLLDDIYVEMLHKVLGNILEEKGLLKGDKRE